MVQMRNFTLNENNNELKLQKQHNGNIEQVSSMQKKRKKERQKQEMEETRLQQKIKKQLEYIREQVTKFLRSFESKNFKSNNFTPYIEAMHRVFDLNNSYGEDYYEFIEKRNLEFILSNNRLLMKDVTGKLKMLSCAVQASSVPPQNKKQAFPDSICKLCNLHIESQTIQVAKSKVDDSGLNQLKRMLKKIQFQSSQALFSFEQDKYFFQQLNKVLDSKLEVMSVTDNHLEKYLDDIMKNLQEIKYLQDLKDTSFPLPTNVNWEAKIKNQIFYVLLNTFKGKIPPWIQKAFEQVTKLNEKIMRQLRETKQCQTDPYVQSQVLELRKEIDMRNQDQKMKRAINQDYIKTIQEKQEKIKSMDIEITALKQIMYSRDSALDKTHSQSRRDSKNPRNSSLSSHRDSLDTKKSKFVQQSLPSSFHESHFAKMNMDESQEMQNGQSLGAQLRKDQSMAEQASPTLFAAHIIKRKKNNRLTMDINFNSKDRSIDKNRSFLPSISKPSPDNLQVPEVNLKKLTSLSALEQKLRSSLNNKQLNTQNSQHLINDPNLSRSIIQVEQGNQRDYQGSQQNITQKFSDEQRKVRIKKYRETITDVRGMMENRVKNSDAMRKLKKTSLLSLNSKWNPMQNHPSASRFSNLQNSNLNDSANDEQLAKLSMVKRQVMDFMTQTQSVQAIMSEGKRTHNQQKAQHSTKADSNRSKLKQSPKLTAICVQIQTQQTKQSLLKKLQETNIEQDQLQKILAKLLSKKKKVNNTGNFSCNRGDNEKENIDSTDIRNRNPAKSMFTEQVNKTSRDISPQKKTLINASTSKHQEANPSTTRRQMPLSTCLFTKKDFTLFLNQQTSFKYESNLKQKYHKSPFIQLTPAQTLSLTSLYNVIQLIKHQSLNQYNNILSFVKYPYQTVVNNFSILNIVKEMSLESWLWYMARIKHCHQKCLEKGDEKRLVCVHIEKFAEKVENILVAAAQQALLVDDQTVNKAQENVVKTKAK